jgi:hypothetical protein
MKFKFHDFRGLFKSKYTYFILEYLFKFIHLFINTYFFKVIFKAKKRITCVYAK